MNIEINDENKKNFFLLLIYQTIENLTYYDYSNEDFCLFKQFA
jgi:hypothetical protein